MQAKNGILGALNEELIDTSKESISALESLKYRPGGAFGSCRFKLKDLESSRKRIYKGLLMFLRRTI